MINNPSANFGFPPVEAADSDGLLAIGGTLSIERLLLAYLQGIFPCYNINEPILWWAPDPRFVLFPDKIKVSKSMRQVLRSNKFRVSLDTAFESVISACSTTPRSYQTEQSTWLVPDMIRAYTQLHHIGYAHSVEVWNTNNQLVGGLYGIAIGKIFYGESMFSIESNASKTGFIRLTHALQAKGYTLIDCQLHSNHLQSLGAEFISRQQFNKILQEGVAAYNQAPYSSKQWTNWLK